MQFELPRQIALDFPPPPPETDQANDPAHGNSPQHTAALTRSAAREIGSTAAALRAGSQQATSATANNTMATA